MVMSYFLEKCGCSQDLVCDDRAGSSPGAAWRQGTAFQQTERQAGGEDVELSTERKVLARYVSAK